MADQNGTIEGAIKREEERAEHLRQELLVSERTLERLREIRKEISKPPAADLSGTSRMRVRSSGRVGTVDRRVEAMVAVLQEHKGAMAAAALIEGVSKKLGEPVNRVRVYDSLRRRADLFRNVKRGQWALKTKGESA